MTANFPYKVIITKTPDDVVERIVTDAMQRDDAAQFLAKYVVDAAHLSAEDLLAGTGISLANPALKAVPVPAEFAVAWFQEDEPDATDWFVLDCPTVGVRHG